MSISSRREFVGSLAGATVATALAGKALAKSHDSGVPVGLELYSVRHELDKDPAGTLQRVAAMGYDCVEFYAPYHDWTAAHAHEVRQELDRLKLRCYSTHNGLPSFSGDGLDKAIELNRILGTRFIVLAHPGENIRSIDEWRAIAQKLDTANQQMAKHGLHGGYHNHDIEWKPVDGQKPMEVIAHNTDKSIMLQLDVGTCLEAGNDPVTWIESNPGRIKSLHLKDWSQENGYKVLFGEGSAPWRKIFAAAEAVGGAEYYLIEQEGSRFPEFETAERCLVAYKDLRSGGKSST